MALTIPQDLIAGFLLGALQVLPARKGVVRADSVRNDYLTRALLFHGFVLLPVGMMFYTRWPDWSVFYFYNANEAPKLGWLLVFCYLPAGLAGNASAQWLLRKKADAGAVSLVAVALAALMVVTVWAGERFVKIGTLAEWEMGVAVPLWKSGEVIAAFGFSGLYVGGALAFVLYRNWKQGQED